MSPFEKIQKIRTTAIPNFDEFMTEADNFQQILALGIFQKQFPSEYMQEAQKDLDLHDLHKELICWSKALTAIENSANELINIRKKYTITETGGNV